jgi:hypothetical protein
LKHSSDDWPCDQIQIPQGNCLVDIKVVCELKDDGGLRIFI